MRKMNRAMMVHKDHASAVYVFIPQVASLANVAIVSNVTSCVLYLCLVFHRMDVAYSPTGREFVAGSYDRTIRIFNVRSTKSREVYHTQRMQRYVCNYVVFSTGDKSLVARFPTHVNSGIAYCRCAVSMM